jgi:NADPH-dependent curcumin reductase CurA
MISQYNAKPDEQYRIKNISQVVGKSLTIRGFIQTDSDMGPKYTDEHQKSVQKWLSEGTLKAAVSVTRGIDNSIDGLLGMFEGRNFGKAVLQIADLESSA